MTVAELIEKLQRFPKDSVVIIHDGVSLNHDLRTPMSAQYNVDDVRTPQEWMDDTGVFLSEEFIDNRGRVRNGFVIINPDN